MLWHIVGSHTLRGGQTMQSQHLYSHFNPSLAYKDTPPAQNMDFPYSPCRMQQPTTFFANHPQGSVQSYMASPTQGSIYNGISSSNDGPMTYGPTAVASQSPTSLNTIDSQHPYYPPDGSYPQYSWIKGSNCETHWWPTTGITAGKHRLLSNLPF